MKGTLIAVVCLWVGVASAEGEDLTQARAWFQRGVEAYDAGKYEDALRDFQQSHALSHNAALYFNMAACEEHLTHYQAAALLLRQYLIEKPDAEDRDKVQSRIQVLEQRDEGLKRPEPPVVRLDSPVPVPVPVPVPEKPRRVISWVLLGVTGAFVVGAVAAGSWSLTRYNDLRSGCGATPEGCSAADKDGVRAGANATDALIGLGATAAVATVVMFLVEPRLRAHKPARTALRLGPAGVVF